MQWVLTVIPGRNTQAARQFNYAPLCPPNPRRERAAVVGVVWCGCDKEVAGISAPCNIVQNFFFFFLVGTREALLSVFPSGATKSDVGTEVVNTQTRGRSSSAIQVKRLLSSRLNRRLGRQCTPPSFLLLLGHVS